MNNTVIYPGTFDPVTNGHLDIIKRAANLFDKVIIGIINSPVKGNFVFSIEDRENMVRESIKDIYEMEVKVFSGLLINFVKQNNVKIVIRGLRAISDFEYEFQMALTNKQIDPEIETLFMMANEEHSFLSSRLVKEIAAYGGDISKFVPDIVLDYMRRKFQK